MDWAPSLIICLIWVILLNISTHQYLNYEMD